MGTVFLLGSGISLNADIPGVAEITAQVVSGEGVFLPPSKVFEIGADNPNYAGLRPPVEPVLELVHDLREVAAEYFDREPNYEEISLLAGQLSDALSREYESAAVMPLVNDLKARSYAKGTEGGLGEVCELARKYIADTVKQMLDKTPSRLCHIGAIIEACKRLSRVDLATLNHDLVLEASLDASGVGYADGFQQTDQDVHLWVDDWGDATVRLLKLHGSLDWWGYKILDEPWRGWVTARYQGDNAIHPSRPGIEHYPHDLRPIFLTGTFSKALAYQTWNFPDQHCRFQEALRETKRVVAVGYGFGDKAVNTRLIGWLARSCANKLVVCHPDPDQLSERARGAIRNGWADWCQAGQLTFIPVCVGQLDYETLASHLA